MNKSVHEGLSILSDHRKISYQNNNAWVLV